jgi:hypothetical protein
MLLFFSTTEKEKQIQEAIRFLQENGYDVKEK